nr:MAG TPA: hypothetical protein [Caudoviricetes sp.]DAS78943.1 MAG TPA: hypothetical protein [Caudoviricetes sp.]
MGCNNSKISSCGVGGSRTLVLTMINKPNKTQYSSYTVNIYF